MQHYGKELEIRKNLLNIVYTSLTVYCHHSNNVRVCTYMSNAKFLLFILFKLMLAGAELFLYIMFTSESKMQFFLSYIRFLNVIGSLCQTILKINCHTRHYFLSQAYVVQKRCLQNNKPYTTICAITRNYFDAHFSRSTC